MEEASCCSFTLVRRAGAFSVEVTRAGDTPDTLHVVAVPGIDPIVEEGSAEKYVPPAATAKPIGDVAIPDMTMPNSARPPDITDPPPSPEKRATVELPPPVPPEAGAVTSPCAGALRRGGRHLERAGSAGPHGCRRQRHSL
ncbi:MAG: hypothetical protein R2704_01395 [Microthrixaceae bacterium]